MELAGLSVAQAVYKIQPPSDGKNKVLVVAGPGNNGGDGLVAARHLRLLGYAPSVYYPKKSKGPLFEGLQTQLHNLDIPFIDDISSAYHDTDQVIDALFGFSFKPPVREPFPLVLELLKSDSKPVISVDIPSGWDVDHGPLDGDTFMPTALVSLTAPKPAAKFFTKRHFVGGRFISKKFADKYGFDIPSYHGLDQVAELK